MMYALRHNVSIKGKIVFAQLYSITLQALSTIPLFTITIP